MPLRTDACCKDIDIDESSARGSNGDICGDYDCLNFSFSGDTIVGGVFVAIVAVWTLELTEVFRWNDLFVFLSWNHLALSNGKTQ